MCSPSLDLPDTHGASVTHRAAMANTLRLKMSFWLAFAGSKWTDRPGCFDDRTLTIIGVFHDVMDLPARLSDF